MNYEHNFSSRVAAIRLLMREENFTEAAQLTRKLADELDLAQKAKDDGDALVSSHVAEDDPEATVGNGAPVDEAPAAAVEAPEPTKRRR